MWLMKVVVESVTKSSLCALLLQNNIWKQFTIDLYEYTTADIDLPARNSATSEKTLISIL
jgi:hypothetical protein